MASKAELKKAIADAREAKNSADRAVKRLTDIHVPRGAKKERRALRDTLRKIVKKMSHRIPLLRKRLKAKSEGGAKDAVKWAWSQVGTSESPYGSNWGNPIQDWIIYTGYSSPVPWCGCFVAWAAVKVGGAKIPTRVSLGYTPYICSQSASGSNGLTRVDFNDVRAGDLVVFHFGSGGAKHVGLAVGPFKNGLTDCVEGNTSSSNGGSQDNGGTVAHRQRPVSHVICVARPDY